jgi:uncharacterized protein YbaP (TraB family)
MQLSLLLSILLAGSSFLQAQSLLWKITPPGQTTPSWIYGTMHVRDERVFRLADGWEIKLKEAGRILLELNLAEHPDPMQMITLMGAPEDSTLEKILSAEETNHLRQWVQDSLGLPWQMANSLKPFFLMAMVQEKQMPADRPEPLDLWLANRAKEWKIPVIGIESIEEQMQAIQTLSISEQARMLMELIQPENENRKEMETELMNAYLSGNLDQLYALSQRWETDPLFMREILQVRNFRMAERIHEHLSEKPGFIAIGALHLPGQEGVLELLRIKGYKVESDKN